ncbi:hypothetical protein BDV95DRAFT_630513 [Massariosphaeria phaeospora]|uniref:Uncharacterized protein n=1 Tax=Massariosphaeria phaeospora TaxID=100035 RepID=A0A7C8IB95_9PLEO|nr:hypothetical protein BDV95DRAFT_630513 [Massariosphaeria phaeospora]
MGTATPPQRTSSRIIDLQGYEFVCDEGSVWRIKEPLSGRRYQQAQPPFEASQAFTCICSDDPSQNHGDVEEAVVKVKYQVVGTDPNVQFYEDYVQECAYDAAQAGNSERSLASLQYAKQLLYVATHPVEEPHESTIQEQAALMWLGMNNAPYSPHLLAYGSDNVTPESDPERMVGGYIVFTVMTKLPGKRITIDWYWRLELAERDEIRKAFKTALLSTWRHHIYPKDSALRNLLWDEQERKCYIVDFEDYNMVKFEDPEAKWVDDYFEFWKLAEKPVHQQGLIEEEAESEERQAPFYLDVFCDAQSRKRDEVHGAIVALKDGKLCLWPKDPATQLPRKAQDGSSAPHPFTGFYLPFPTEDLPGQTIPARPILGLVSTLPSTTPSTSKSVKPKLNWIYADKETREVKYGPRVDARDHVTGPWDWTEDDEEGLTLHGEECFVAVEVARGGYGWEVYWDKDDNRLEGLGIGEEKRVLRCSLERRLVNEDNVKMQDH